MATQTLGAGGMATEARTFYEMQLLTRRIPDFFHNEFGMPVSIPRGNGVNASLRRFARPGAQTTALTEGTPPTALNPTVEQVTLTVQQFGGYMLGSDILDWQAIDPIVTGYTQAFGDDLQDTRDLITRNIINAGTNTQYAGTATARTGLSSTAAALTFAELREAASTLKRNDVKPIRKGLAAGKFAAIIHPDSVRDLLGDSNVTNVFQYAVNRGAAQGGENPLQTGQLGDLIGFRFFETSNATIRSSAGQSGADVYQLLLIGEEAYAHATLTAANSEVIFHGKGTSGILDPLNQAWSLGWKIAHTAAILDQQRILSVEHVTSRKYAA